MYKVIIDLGNRIKVFVIRDNVLVDVSNLEYGRGTLDALRSIVSTYNASSVRFITHNLISRCLYKDTCVAFQASDVPLLYVSVIDTSDLLKLQEIMQGVPDVSFIDVIGKMIDDNDKTACYVEEFDGLTRMYAVEDGQIMNFSVCSSNVFEERKVQFMSKNRLTTVKNLCDLGDVFDLMVFENSPAMLEDSECLEMVSELSLCAYAFESENKPWIYTFDVLHNSTTDIMQVEETMQESVNNIQVCNTTYEQPVGQLESISDVEDVLSFSGFEYSETENLEDDENIDDPSSDVTDDLSGIKQVSPTKKRYKIKKDKATKRSNVLLLIGIIGIIATCAIMLFYVAQSNKLKDLNTSVDKKTLELNDINAAKNTYNNLLDVNANRAFTLLDSIEADIIKYNAELKNLDINGNVSSVKLQFASNKNMKKFVKAVSTTYPKYTCNVEKSGDAKTTIVTIISAA